MNRWLCVIPFMCLAACEPPVENPDVFVEVLSQQTGRVGNEFVSYQVCRFRLKAYVGTSVDQFDMTKITFEFEGVNRSDAVEFVWEDFPAPVKVGVEPVYAVAETASDCKYYHDKKIKGTEVLAVDIRQFDVVLTDSR